MSYRARINSAKGGGMWMISQECNPQGIFKVCAHKINKN
jgi:hypothetical protein